MLWSALFITLCSRVTCSRNRFRPFEDVHQATRAFAKLTELQLNQTLMTWLEMETIVKMIPTLRIIEMGYNRLTDLHSSDNILSNIQVVNLDRNEIRHWSHIHHRFQFYHRFVSSLLKIGVFNLLQLAASDRDVKWDRNHSISLCTFRVVFWSSSFGPGPQCNHVVVFHWLSVSMVSCFRDTQPGWKPFSRCGPAGDSSSRYDW